MNIDSLNEFIANFRAQVVESGFKRDIGDYVNSLSSLRENIINLRATAKLVQEALEAIHCSDLPDAMRLLFPKKKPVPFTDQNFHEQVRSLLADKDIQQEDFFAEFQRIINELHASLETNEEEVDRIAEFILPYVKDHQSKITADQKAVFSILFKDKRTISALDEFSKTLASWNRTLPQYHQLVTGKSPSGVEIVAVQNGSIDVVVNLDVNVAVDLAQLFKIGFLAFAAYLLHKKNLQPMIAGYRNNPKLLAIDKQKDELLLENIGQEVEAEARAQFDRAPKELGSSPDNPDIVITQVTRLVTSHIIKGNDVKILALPADSPASKDGAAPAGGLMNAATEARKVLRQLPPGEITPLLTYYADVENAPDSTESGELKNKPKAKKKG
jgi:hypothetical protein